MKSNSKGFNSYILILYTGFLAVILVLGYLLFSHEPLIFKRVISLWPIGVLILSVLLQYLYFELEASVFLLLSGFSFVYGLMFTINLHKPFFTEKMIFPILFLAIAGGILDYYIFRHRSDLFLPFIFIFILSGILLLIFPIYSSYLKTSGSPISFLTVVILISSYIILRAIIK